MSITSTIAAELIPDNLKGKPSDLEFSTSMASHAEACRAFRRAVTRLLNPSLWHSLAGWASANFLLIGPDEEEVDRLADEGDYIRIDIPGPGPGAGDGYDWVVVERIDDQLDPGGLHEWLGMKVHPCSKPRETGRGTAHFFQEDASSTFVIERRENKVIARYHGRNEVPNTSTGHPLDNIRNAVVSAGAMISFSQVQWAALTKGFLLPETGG